MTLHFPILALTLSTDLMLVPPTWVKCWKPVRQPSLTMDFCRGLDYNGSTELTTIWTPEKICKIWDSLLGIEFQMMLPYSSSGTTVHRSLMLSKEVYMTTHWLTPLFLFCKETKVISQTCSIIVSSTTWVSKVFTHIKLDHNTRSLLMTYFGPTLTATVDLQAPTESLGQLFMRKLWLRYSETTNTLRAWNHMNMCMPWLVHQVPLSTIINIVLLKTCSTL